MAQDRSNQIAFAKAIHCSSTTWRLLRQGREAMAQVRAAEALLGLGAAILVSLIHYHLGPFEFLPRQVGTRGTSPRVTTVDGAAPAQFDRSA